MKHAQYLQIELKPEHAKYGFRRYNWLRKAYTDEHCGYVRKTEAYKWYALGYEWRFGKLWPSEPTDYYNFELDCIKAWSKMDHDTLHKAKIRCNRQSRRRVRQMLKNWECNKDADMRPLRVEPWNFS